MPKTITLTTYKLAKLSLAIKKVLTSLKLNKITKNNAKNLLNLIKRSFIKIEPKTEIQIFSLFINYSSTFYHLPSTHTNILEYYA